MEPNQGQPTQPTGGGGVPQSSALGMQTYPSQNLQNPQGQQNPSQGGQAYQQPGQQKMCIWSILSIICAFVFWILGIIFGIVALVTIKNNPNLKGKGLAIAGIIISVIWIPMFLVLIGAIAYFGVLDPSSMLPDRCTFGTDFRCYEYSLEVTGSTLTGQAAITNSQDQEIVIDPTGSACNSYEKPGTLTVTETELAPSGQTKLICTVDGVDVSQGDQTKIAMDISYYPKSSGDAYMRSASGDVFAKVS